jgi:hypothetical protein
MRGDGRIFLSQGNGQKAYGPESDRDSRSDQAPESVSQADGSPHVAADEITDGPRAGAPTRAAHVYRQGW